MGVLLMGAADGHHAVARTFWADANANDGGEVNLSPIETHIDLNGGLGASCDIAGMMAGGFAGISHDSDDALSLLLDHVRFRFDDSWALYYRAAATTPRAQRDLINATLATVARDVPLLLGFFLLLSAKDATRSMPVSRALINRKRSAQGRAPLLDHIEVHASLDTAPAIDAAGDEAGSRQSPRMHHVRGHLVRRDDRVFWRVPHLRGSASRGMVRSRTVCPSFARDRHAHPELSA